MSKMIIEKRKDNPRAMPICGREAIIELAIKGTVYQQNAMSKKVARKSFFLYFQVLSCFVITRSVTRCCIVIQICVTGFHMKFTQPS
jgi:hypothetical protein